MNRLIVHPKGDMSMENDDDVRLLIHPPELSDNPASSYLVAR
jgi:hypothetical protein